MSLLLQPQQTPAPPCALPPAGSLCPGVAECPLSGPGAGGSPIRAVQLCALAFELTAGSPPGLLKQPASCPSWLAGQGDLRLRAADCGARRQSTHRTDGATRPGKRCSSLCRRVAAWCPHRPEGGQAAPQHEASRGAGGGFLPTTQLPVFSRKLSSRGSEKLIKMPPRRPGRPGVFTTLVACRLSA